MAIQELNKTEVAAVSGAGLLGSLALTLGGVPAVGGLLTGLLASVKYVVSSWVGPAATVPVVGGLLSSIVASVDGLL